MFSIVNTKISFLWYCGAPLESTTFWPLWWRISLSIRLYIITQVILAFWLVLFFRARWGKRPAFALCWNIFLFLKYFEIKKAFRYYIKQIDSMLPCVWFSNRSQKTSKCGKNISDTLGYASCATFLFLPYFDIICDLLLNRCMATWNLFECLWHEKYFLLIWKAFQNTEEWCFSFWNIFFRFRDIEVFLLCKLDKWWRHIVCN